MPQCLQDDKVHSSPAPCHPGDDIILTEVVTLQVSLLQQKQLLNSFGRNPCLDEPVQDPGKRVERAYQDIEESYAGENLKSKSSDNINSKYEHSISIHYYTCDYRARTQLIVHSYEQ